MNILLIVVSTVSIDTVGIFKSQQPLVAEPLDGQWFENAIFIAIAAAIFTQLLVTIVTYIDRKRDLTQKRKMILKDLIEKKRLAGIELTELRALKEAARCQRHLSASIAISI